MLVLWCQVPTNGRAWPAVLRWVLVVAFVSTHVQTHTHTRIHTHTHTHAHTLQEQPLHRAGCQGAQCPGLPPTSLAQRQPLLELPAQKAAGGEGGGRAVNRGRRRGTHWWRAASPAFPWGGSIGGAQTKLPAPHPLQQKATHPPTLPAAPAVDPNPVWLQAHANPSPNPNHLLLP